MPQQRIKGQEVSVIIVRDAVVEAELVDIKSMSVELELETKSQGYLGEKTNRKDDIFNGVKGDMEMHLHSQEYFLFTSAIVDRAKRVTPDVVFNISAVLSFPSGETPTVLIPDAKFGANPLSISDRGDYVSAKFAFEADDYEIQYS